MSVEPREAQQLDAEIARWLSGQLEPERAEALRRRLDEDPALRHRLEELEEAWRFVELGPTSPPPPGFSTRIAAAARAESGAELGAGPWSWAAAPVWVRGSLLAGLLVGLLLGLNLGGPQRPEAWPVEASGPAPTLAELFWTDVLEGSPAQ